MQISYHFVTASSFLRLQLASVSMSKEIPVAFVGVQVFPKLRRGQSLCIQTFAIIVIIASIASYRYRGEFCILVAEITVWQH